jgi:hypothetical protein
MGRLRDWWQRLTGASHEPAPQPHKAVVRQPQPPSDGLELADDEPRDRPSHTGAAGFDPYSSDAGYSKPHSWERVDHD